MPTWSEADLLRWAGDLTGPWSGRWRCLPPRPSSTAPWCPVPLKVALAMVLALLIGGIVGQSAPLELSWTTLVLTGEQIMVGIAIGFSMQLALTAMSVAGDLIGVQMGFGFATLLGIQGSLDVPVMSDSRPGSGAGAVPRVQRSSHPDRGAREGFAIVPVGVGSSIPLAGWALLAARGAMLFEIGVFLALPIVAVIYTMHAVGTLSAGGAADQSHVGGVFTVPVGRHRRDDHAGAVFRATVEHMIDAGVGLIGAVVRAP